MRVHFSAARLGLVVVGEEGIVHTGKHLLGRVCMLREGHRLAKIRALHGSFSAGARAIAEGTRKNKGNARQCSQKKKQ